MRSCSKKGMWLWLVKYRTDQKCLCGIFFAFFTADIGLSQNRYENVANSPQKCGLSAIAKKVCIFVLVGIANIIDTQILQNGAAIRTAVVFFYLANEGLSCLENAAVIGLPVPEKLKEMLAQLKEERENKDD